MNQKLIFKLSLVLVAAISSAPAFAEPSSFQHVRDRVYEHPVDQLSTASAFSKWDAITGILGQSNKLVKRMWATLLDEPSDFKPRAPKTLHPKGICADAVWEIHKDSGSTGLLEKGTRVNAMIRLSASDNQPEYSPNSVRTMGMAIKLFPTQDPNQAIESRNIQLLDQNGMDGGKRKSVFFPNVHFTNRAVGVGTVAKITKKLLSRFDIDPLTRPLYPFANVNAYGVPVEKVKNPTLIFFVPHFKNRWNAKTIPMDLRNEIAGYGAGEIKFDIVIPEQAGVAESETIGVLTLGRPVMSEVCELELHFQHALH